MSRDSAAHNPEFERVVRSQTDAFARNTPYHSLELNDGRIVPGIIPVEQLRARLDAYPLPRDLRGKRALDIGAASGWNSFELERRGAEVVATDCVEYEEFLVAKRLLGSKVDYRILDVDEMSPEVLGTFDYVLFLGVLYHLRHPLLGLEKVCALTREAAFVESYVIDPGPALDSTVLEFYETDELGGQVDNWYGPSTQCLAALCRSAGFARVEMLYNNDRRAGLACFRRWEPEDPNAASRPLLTYALNNRHDDPWFTRNKDEYICLHFRAPGLLTRGEVFVEVDGYGVPALAAVERGPQTWQANVRVPPGLGNGAHLVRVRTPGSALSNAVKIFMGEDRPSRVARSLPPACAAPPPRLIALESTLDHSTVFHGYRNENLRCFFACEEDELEIDSVEVSIDGDPQLVLAVGRHDDESWQLVSKVNRDLEAGERQVRLRTARSGLSEPLPLTFRPSIDWT
jgi:tRNA (mo5U34)-methyltransferase